MINYARRVKVLTYVSIIFLIFPANAGHTGRWHKTKKNYIRVAAGYSYPFDKHNSLSPTNSYSTRSKGAFLGSIGVGYIINSNFKTDIIASYSGEYRYKGTHAEGTDFSDVDSIRLMLNGYWHFKNLYRKCLRCSTRFSPYLMAGIGYANNTTKSIETRTPTTTIIFTGKQKRNLAWQIGVGSLFHINRNIDIDLLYKYADLGKVTSGITDRDINDPGVWNTNSPLNEKLRAHEVSIGCIFKFN